jgi:hypothetical protein
VVVEPVRLALTYDADWIRRFVGERGALGQHSAKRNPLEPAAAVSRHALSCSLIRYS